MVLVGQGQQGSGSPYSAYGLGELFGGTQVSQLLMGGPGAAVVDPVSVVAANPASYPAMHRTTFETGLGVRTSRFTSSEVGRTGRRAELLGFSLGVPFAKGRWGVALGVNPVSNVGYNITNTQALPDGSGNVELRYTGDGGLNKAFFGLGWVLAQKRDSLSNGYRLSIGANLGYVFGSIEESRKAIYPRSAGFYNSSVVSTLILRDPTANVGVQFQGDLRKRVNKDEEGFYYLIGVSAELPTTLGARRSELATSFGLTNSGVELTADTAFFAESQRGTLQLPLGIGVGFTVFNNNWTVSAEVRQRDWRQLKVAVDGYELPNELATSTTYILGAGFRPARKIDASFWERTTYRAGVRYNSDYLVVGGTQLQEIGMSFGMSLPVMGSTTRSRLNIGAELGERGTLDNGLIRERFAAILIGITITPDIREQWFKKRRIE